MRWAWLALVAGLSGCAAPDLGAPLAAFSDSIGKAEATFAKVDEAATARENRKRLESAVKEPHKVVMAGAPGTQCLSDSEACTLIFDGKLLRADTLVGEQRILLREIANYAEALKQLTAADSTGKVKAAADKATAAISGIAVLVSGGPAAAFAAPVAQLVTWIYGRYQDNLKRSALRHATGEMAPVLQRATDMFGTTTEFLIEPERTEGERRVTRAANEFRLNPSAATATAYLDRAGQMNTLLKARPSAVFLQVNATHQELVRVVNDRDLTLAALFRHIDKLAADIETLAKALDAFQKAAG